MAQSGDSHCSDSETTQPAEALYNVHRSAGRIMQNYPASVEEPASGSVLDYSEVASAMYTIRKGPQGVQKTPLEVASYNYVYKHSCTNRLSH